MSIRHRRNSVVALLSIATLIPAVAMAHPGHVHDNGLMAGLLHPLTGVDHIAAMLAAGLWAAQRGERSIGAVLAATVIGILLGTLFGMSSQSLTLAEQGTALSAVALGLLAASAARPRLVGVALVVLPLCFLHGYVHAIETPRQFSQLAFTGGFVSSMLALQFMGAAAAASLARRPALVSRAGLGCALAGVLALSGLA